MDKKFIDLSKKNNSPDTENYNTQYAGNGTQTGFQNTNNQTFFDYNNTNNNNYQQQNPYQQTQYPQQPQYQPQPPQNNFNRQYADQPKKKTPTGMYILLIAVIIFFAVIIVAMSTIMKAIVNKNDKNKDNDNLRGNVTLSESAEDEESEEDTEEETETELSEEITKTNSVQIAEISEEPVVTEAEPEREPETVTVIVEVPVEPEPEPEYHESPANTSDSVNIYYDYWNYGTISTQKDPLNLRSSPSKSAKILTSIPKGTRILFYSTSDPDWFYTTYNNQSGYISSDYIALDPLDYGYYDSYIPSTAVVSTKQDVLNLRQSASTNGTIITGIPKGSTVTIVEFGYDWCYVSWGGYTGYVSTQYLSY